MKAQEFLERAKVSVLETVDATKVRMPRDAALALAKARATRIVTSRQTAPIKPDGPSDDELAAMILGPTGNLKAPAMLIGKTLYVGFNEALYKKLFE